MQAAVRGRYRTTRPPFPGSWPYPERFCRKALPVARRSTYGHQSRRIFGNSLGPFKINLSYLQTSGSLAAWLHPWAGCPAPSGWLKG